MNGQALSLGSIKTAMRRGIGLVPEDRKRQGLVLGMSGRANYSLAMLDRLSRLGLLDKNAERREAQDYFKRCASRRRRWKHRSPASAAAISRRSRWPNGSAGRKAPDRR